VAGVFSAVLAVGGGLAIAPPANSAALAPSGVVKAKPAVQLASLTAVSAVPRSKRAWAVGYAGHGASTLAYAMRSTAKGRWTSVAVKSASSVYLQGVAAGSATSIWAVGDHNVAAGQKPLIEHSTGGGFTPVKTTLGLGSLQSVAASSAANAWAIGAHPSGSPLVARWNGQTWAKVTLGGPAVQLSAVSVSSPTNVWLVGVTAAGPEVAHWNGHSFDITALSAPSVVAGIVPTAISTTAVNNVWLAGYVPGAAASGSSTLVTAHFDGTAWSPVSVPSRAVRNVPSSIAAIGSTVYLAGYDGPKSMNTSASFVLEYSAGRWRTDAVAKPGKNGVLLSVSASSKTAVAVGSWYAGAAAGSHRTPPHPFVVVRKSRAWHQPKT
jgi:hypothetical protein